jgi:galactokinase
VRLAGLLKVAASLRKAQGVLEAHDADLKAFELDLLCDGNVPAGGGLSSSAAMVIASSLACLKALGQLDSITRTAMTEIAIDSERLVGVNSGGCALDTRTMRKLLIGIRKAWTRRRASLASAPL